MEYLKKIPTALNKIANRIHFFIDYFYYCNSTLIKNTYPLKLLGEKFYLDKDETYIIFKILGQPLNYHLQLSYLLNNKKIIEGFNERDALSLGSLAFKDLILNLNKEIRFSRFIKIMNFMLTPSYELFPANSVNTGAFNNFPNYFIDIEQCINQAVLENFYPCKLVGGKFIQEHNYINIIYTIFGKREGYEKSLVAFVNDKNLLAKFHPTEIIKFGFIYAGYNFFKL